MKRILKYAYYGIISLLLLIIISNYTSYLKKKQKAEKNQIQLKIDSFPISLLSSEVSDVKCTKIIFIYSEFSCEQCIISYLKALKEAMANLKCEEVQIIVCGKVELAKFMQYTKIYKLNFVFLERSEESIYELIPDLEIPAVILLDDNNKIITCWRADPIQLPLIILKIRRYLNRKMADSLSKFLKNQNISD